MEPQLEMIPSFTKEEKVFVAYLASDPDTIKKIGTFGKDTLLGLLNKMGDIK
jgi:hypothetical protein